MLWRRELIRNRLWRKTRLRRGNVKIGRRRIRDHVVLPGVQVRRRRLESGRGESPTVGILHGRAHLLEIDVHISSNVWIIVWSLLLNLSLSLGLCMISYRDGTLTEEVIFLLQMVWLDHGARNHGVRGNNAVGAR